jgi:glutathione S-transferase
MLELYHNDMSVCAQKVRHLLCEKGLPWQSRHMSLRHKEQFEPTYLVHHGQAVIESTIICEYVEDAFSERPFRPASHVEKARMRNWTKQLDDTIHAATVVATVCIGIRHQYSEAHTPEELDAVLDAVPNPKWRTLKRQLIANGVDHPDLPDALVRLKKMLVDMEEALRQSPWLAGNELSLADIGLLPYVVRIDHLNLHQLIEERPHVARWYRDMRQRPAFEQAYLGQWHNERYVNDLMEKGGQAKGLILDWLAA